MLIIDNIPIVSERAMPIKVLLADDSDIMRTAVARVLTAEPRVELVGTAANFAQAMQMRVDFRPELLIMDLHLPGKREFTPPFVKSQLASIPTIAMSVANDDDARGLAVSYGVLTLLDKMNLYDDLLPAIVKFASPAFRSPLARPSAPPASSAASA
jgi:DNA-binding NarL/FixJ family response regulator